MLDLPFVDKKILPFAVEIEVMKRSGAQNDQKPHKLIMILAVLDLIDQGAITENRIYLNSSLINNFEKFFRNCAGKNDLCQPGPPFFHLRNSSFWKHKIRDGREKIYASLVTSGGGIKRIQENIEYAYFNDYVYSLIVQKKYRVEIMRFIENMLPSLRENYAERIPSQFHESFPLSRSSITQILKAIFYASNDLDLKSKAKREEYLSSNTTLGPNYIKSMPNYCKGAALLDFEYRLIPFGKKAFTTDLLLEQKNTQWIIHYHLSAPLGPGPRFWHELVKTRFRCSDEFTTQDIADQISSFYEHEEGKPLAQRSARSTATIFLRTYTRPDGLGNLGLLEEISQEHYRVMDPDPPSTWVTAYALFHWWISQFKDQITVNLGDLYGDQGLTQILMIGKGYLNNVLEVMQDEGYIQLFRTAPPYQVVLLRRDEASILEKIYGG